MEIIMIAILTSLRMGGQKGCSINFVSVTSLKVGISPQNV